MFFSPSRAVLSAILRDEYLTSAVRTKEGDKAGSNQPPARDPVQFKLELTPNYLISYLENTGSRSTRYVSMPHPNESSILPKFLEKSDPEVTRPAFSTWPVQKSQPKAFEVCASIQIHQSAYRDRWQFKTTTLPRTGMFVWSRYADCWIWIDAHNSNAFGCAPPYNILYISHLSLSMPLLQQLVIIVCFCLFQVLTNILFKGSYVNSCKEQIFKSRSHLRKLLCHSKRSTGFHCSQSRSSTSFLF